MKNYLKPIIFSIILIVFIIILGKLFAPKNNSITSGMMDIKANGILGEKENTLDVIFIGDSLTYSSFIPLLMYKENGFTSYVCGTHAQRMFDSYKFLEKSIEKQKPKIVVLETNALFRKYSLKKDIISKLEKTFPFFEYHNRWKNLSINDFKSSKDYKYTDPMKGYMLKRSVKSVSSKDYMKHNNKSTYIPEGNYKYLEMMRKKCEKNNIKFVLVSATSQVNYNYSKYQTLKKYAEENKIDYIDLNIDNTIDIDWQTDTSDKGDHLNFQGAKKESIYLGKYLKEKYNLPDHRNDINYSEWTRNILEYEKIAS